MKDLGSKVEIQGQNLHIRTGKFKNLQSQILSEILEDENDLLGSSSFSKFERTDQQGYVEYFPLIFIFAGFTVLYPESEVPKKKP